MFLLVPLEPQEGTSFHGPGDTGSCESPDTGSGTKIGSFGKAVFCS